MFNRALPLTTPRHIQKFYADRYESGLGERFTDLASFRSFVSYQIRLVTSLIASAKGYYIDDPVEICKLNRYLILSDFQDLEFLIGDLNQKELVKVELVVQILGDLKIVSDTLFVESKRRGLGDRSYEGNPRISHCL